jgi:hypothetical protein
MKGAGLGKKIDEHEHVVRLKNCSELLETPKDYGRKTTIMFSSTEVCWQLHKVVAEEYWCFPKYDAYNTDLIDQLRKHVNGSRVRVLTEQSRVWNKLFRDMGGKHPNVSTGMAAVISACELLNPRVLRLAGFDVLFNPALPYVSTVPSPFNNGGTKDTGHDWACESKLLQFIGEHFKSVNISKLC